MKELMNILLVAVILAGISMSVLVIAKNYKDTPWAVEHYKQSPAEVRTFMRSCLSHEHKSFSMKKVDPEIGGWLVKCRSIK